MPRYKDFYAEVKCMGKPLDEYKEGIDVKDTTDNTYQCWVASEQGKQFSINYESELGWVDYKVVIYVDGVRTAGSLVVSRERRGGGSQGVPVGDDLFRPYVFSDVQLTDDESLADIRIETSRIGEITIKIFRVKLRQRYQTGSCGGESDTTLPDGMVHEGKKVNGHRTILGDMIQRRNSGSRSKRLPASARYTWSSLNGESEKSPYVTFKFLYRPKATLIAQGIVASPRMEQSQGLEEKVDRRAVERMLFSDSPSLSVSRPNTAPPPQGGLLSTSPDHSAMKRRVREIIDLCADDATETTDNLRRNLEEARKQMTEVQRTFIKAEPWLVKNEVIDLTLE